jgi:hypothetical protein
MFLRSAYCIVATLPALWLGGCADRLPTGQPMKRFTEMVRSYDKTLTKSEKKAAITELQEDKERQQAQIENSDAKTKN